MKEEKSELLLMKQPELKKLQTELHMQTARTGKSRGNDKVVCAVSTAVKVRRYLTIQGKEIEHLELL